MRSELTTLVHRDPESGELTLLARNFGRRFEVPTDPADTVVEDGDV